MQITDFKRIGKSSKYKVFVDNEFWTILYDETIITFKLNKNEQYEPEFLEEVYKEGEKKVALYGALKLLSLFSKTEKELAEYLKNKNYREETIDFCLQKLKDLTYLNDEIYAQNYVMTKKDLKGKKAIEQELKIKGVRDEIIKNALSEIIENQQEEILILANKFVKNKDKDLKLKEKLYRHLASKGFDYDEIKFAINEVLNKNNESY